MGLKIIINTVFVSLIIWRIFCDFIFSHWVQILLDAINVALNPLSYSVFNAD